MGLSPVTPFSSIQRWEDWPINFSQVWILTDWCQKRYVALNFDRCWQESLFGNPHHRETPLGNPVSGVPISQTPPGNPCIPDWTCWQHVQSRVKIVLCCWGYRRVVLHSTLLYTDYIWATWMQGLHQHHPQSRSSRSQTRIPPFWADLPYLNI